jgi:hypothetical protein
MRRDGPTVTIGLMFEYTEGLTWFVGGLALTLAFAALTVLLAFTARAAERRRRRS